MAGLEIVHRSFTNVKGSSFTFFKRLTLFFLYLYAVGRYSYKAGLEIVHRSFMNVNGSSFTFLSD